MFTGIIEEMGKVQSIQKSSLYARLTIGAKTVLDGIKLGDSIAVNGVCLTVSSLSASNFTADVVHETLERSSMGLLRMGNIVNLERAMAVSGRFGGHIVTGHIDGTGIITNIKKDNFATLYSISTSSNIMRYVIEKGSITLDGISLTVAKIAIHEFQISVIPHTAKNTNLARKRIGDVINIENDCIGKYVENLLGDNDERSNITKEMLLKLDY